MNCFKHIFFYVIIFVSFSCSKNNWDNLHDDFSSVTADSWKPQQVLLTTLSITERQLTWYHPSGSIDGFGIDKRDTHGEWQSRYATVAASVHFWIDTAVRPELGKTVAYRIYTLAGKSKSSFVEVANSTSIPQPEGLAVERTDDIHYRLSWTDQAKGEDGYIISRKINNEPWVEKFAILDADSKQFIDSTTFSSKEVLDVQYKVVAYSGLFTSEPATINSTASLTAPTNLMTEFYGEGITRLTWMDNSIGEAGFRIEKKESMGDWSFLGFTPDSEFYDHEFKEGVVTSYRVAACISDFCSDYSENTFYFKLSEPTSFSCMRLSIDKVRLAWTDGSNGEDGHLIERNNGDGIWHEVAKVNGAACEDWINPFVEQVTYRICAYKLNLKSAYLERDYLLNIPSPISFTGVHNATSNTITLHWQVDIGGQDGFFIDRRKDSEPWEDNYAQLSAPVLSFVDNVVQNAVYSYRIRTSFGSYSSTGSTLRVSTWPFGISMVLVSGGSFEMGCSTGQTNCENDETPVRTVTLSSFRIGVTEVTQKQWFDVMGEYPSHFEGCDSCPVENVSWDQVTNFCTILNEATGQNYSLPTEAQWEFAARGGNFSQNLPFSGSSIANTVAWMNNNCLKTQQVAQKLPNELGVFDMSGNVMEWCYDRYGTYPNANQTNPTGSTTGEQRVNRGGSWLAPVENCRVIDRNSSTPGTQSSQIGFRLVKMN